MNPESEVRAEIRASLAHLNRLLAKTDFTLDIVTIESYPDLARRIVPRDIVSSLKAQIVALEETINDLNIVIEVAREMHDKRG